MGRIKDRSLYLVITEEYGMGRRAIDIAKSAITGGVDIIQMREKDKPPSELVELGKKLARLCKDNKVLFIVNDDPALAKETNADGVHLGQEDIKRYSLKKPRGILGKNRIIGISTHSVEQFEDANKEDFDYMAFGPIFETKTKDYFLGTDSIEHVLSIAKKPVFFIGGMNFSNIDIILKKNAKNIALIRGILEAENITSRTKEFKEKMLAYGNKNKR